MPAAAQKKFPDKVAIAAQPVGKQIPAATNIGTANPNAMPTATNIPVAPANSTTTAANLTQQVGNDVSAQTATSVVADAGITSSLGASASMVIQGAQELFGIGTGPMTLDQVVTQMQSLGAGQNPQILTQIQNDLSAAGAYTSRTYHPRLGILSTEDVTALTNMAKYTSLAGTNLNDHLTQAAQFGQATGFGPAGLSAMQNAGVTEGTADITDPNAINLAVDDVFQKALGRGATDAEKAAFVTTFQQSEHNAAAQAFAVSARAQKAYLKAQQAAQTGGTNQQYNADNPNSDFVNQAATGPVPSALDGPGSAAFDAQRNGQAPTAAADPTIDPEHGTQFATQAAQTYGLRLLGSNTVKNPEGTPAAVDVGGRSVSTAQTEGNGAPEYEIGGPNGTAVQSLYSWAQNNVGSGKLFSSVSMGAPGLSGSSVKVTFNETAGADARQTLLALGAQAPSTSTANYGDQRNDFLDAMKQTKDGGNYTWTPNQQTGGYGAYGFSQSQWQVAAQAAGIPQADLNNPSSQEQDAAALALVDQYYHQFNDWSLVAAALYGGPGVAQAGQNDPNYFATVHNGNQTAQDYINSVMTNFDGPGGGQGNSSGSQNNVMDITKPDLQADALAAAQTQDPSEYQANQMSQQYDVFVNLLKGPSFTGRLPTA